MLLAHNWGEGGRWSVMWATQSGERKVHFLPSCIRFSQTFPLENTRFYYQMWRALVWLLRERLRSCAWRCGGVLCMCCFLFGFSFAAILTFCRWMRLHVTPTHISQNSTDPDCWLTPRCVWVRLDAAAQHDMKTQNCEAGWWLKKYETDPKIIAVKQWGDAVGKSCVFPLWSLIF